MGLRTPGLVPLLSGRPCAPGLPGRKHSRGRGPAGLPPIFRPGSRSGPRARPTSPIPTQGTPCRAAMSRTGSTCPGPHETIARPWLSPNSSETGAIRSDNSTSMPSGFVPSPAADSTRAQASPPSAQSWAERNRPLRIMVSIACWRLRSAVRSSQGGSPATSSWNTYKYSEPPSSSRLAPSRRMRSPVRTKAWRQTLSTSSTIPTIPTTGVG